MSVNSLMLALYAELAEEIPDVLSTPFTFAALWADLARVAGEPVPRDVAAVLDAPVPVRRGSYADHRLQFPELYTLPRGDLTITEILARCPHPTHRAAAYNAVGTPATMSCPPLEDRDPSREL